MLLLFLSLTAPVPMEAGVSAMNLDGRGHPEQDIVLDCQLVRTANPTAAPRLWRAGTSDYDRFVWALRGRSSLFGADEVSVFGSRGPSHIFQAMGVSSARIDWPRRVEINGTSQGGPDAHQEYTFRVLRFDRARDRVRVAVTEYRVPYGLRRVRIPVNGHFGDCRVWQGALAHQVFESAE